jgi:hypothetical protein
MDKIVNTEATPPSQTTRNYPPDLEAIVMQMLARKPDDRYQTAEAMLQELDAFLAQHRLWVSPKQLSKYMRTVFADRVDAMNRAIEGGDTLAQHLASIQTFDSAPSALFTPPSAFPAVVPLSQEMPSVKDSAELPILANSAEAAPVRYPVLRSSSRARIVIGIVLLLALGVAGYFAFMAVQHDADSIAVPAAEPPAPVPAAVVDAGAKPADPVPEIKPAETKPAEPPKSKTVAPPTKRSPPKHHL